MAGWVVQPFVALGPVRLGSSRSAVRAMLDEDPAECQKGEDAIPVEAYDTAGAHAYYDQARHRSPTSGIPAAWAVARECPVRLSAVDPAGGSGRCPRRLRSCRSV